MKLKDNVQAALSAIREAEARVNELGAEDVLAHLAQCKRDVWRLGSGLNRRRAVKSARDHFIRTAARLMNT